VKKILVIGVKGMAGHVIFKSLTKLGDYEVYGVARNIDSTDRVFNLDVSDTKGLEEIINLDFDVIINSIGILNKDAEDNPHKAIWFNSYFPHLLESLTKGSKTKVISISTDCVFSGKKGGYKEADIRDGEGFYSMSKSLGEIINDKDLTIRTSIIGPELNKNGIGLFHWFTQQSGEIKGYTSGIWSGVTTIQLAKTILHILRHEPLSGLIHLTNNVPISKFALLNIFKKIFNRTDISIKAYHGYHTDKSLLSTRKDVNFNIPQYEVMISDMKEWIKENNSLYNN